MLISEFNMRARARARTHTHTHTYTHTVITQLLPSAACQNSPLPITLFSSLRNDLRCIQPSFIQGKRVQPRNSFGIFRTLRVSSSFL